MSAICFDQTTQQIYARKSGVRRSHRRNGANPAAMLDPKGYLVALASLPWGGVSRLIYARKLVKTCEIILMD